MGSFIPEGNVTLSSQYSAIALVSEIIPNTSGRLDFHAANVSRFKTQPLGKLFSGRMTEFSLGVNTRISFTTSSTVGICFGTQPIQNKHIVSNVDIFISYDPDVFDHDDIPSRTLRVTSMASLYSY